jgi:hypothetical protein
LEDTGWDQRSGRVGQERQERTARALDPILAVIAEHRDDFDHRHHGGSRYGRRIPNEERRGKREPDYDFPRRRQVSMISYASPEGDDAAV